MLCSTCVFREPRVAVAAFTGFIFFLFLAEPSQGSCGRECVTLNCNSVGIRYGKYCGVGWTGCPGEQPCDDVDACCKNHDECVGKLGVTSVMCHERFKRCIKRARRFGKPGFSKECPYETVVATMVRGMDMAILVSPFAKSLFG